jgi:hypothetical protein
VQQQKSHCYNSTLIYGLNSFEENKWILSTMDLPLLSKNADTIQMFWVGGTTFPGSQGTSTSMAGMTLRVAMLAMSRASYHR